MAVAQAAASRGAVRHRSARFLDEPGAGPADRLRLQHCCCSAPSLRHLPSTSATRVRAARHAAHLSCDEARRRATARSMTYILETGSNSPTPCSSSRGSPRRSAPGPPCRLASARPAPWPKAGHAAGKVGCASGHAVEGSRRPMVPNPDAVRWLRPRITHSSKAKRFSRGEQQASGRQRLPAPLRLLGQAAIRAAWGPPSDGRGTLTPPARARRKRPVGCGEDDPPHIPSWTRVLASLCDVPL